MDTENKKILNKLINYERENKLDFQNENNCEQLYWKRFKKWMHCFCVVTFDLELGQTIEVVYPGSAYLSPIERSDICYLSFPDSNSSSTINNSPPVFLNGKINRKVSSDGIYMDSSHHFRIKRNLNEENGKSFDSFAQKLPPSLKPDKQFLYGFAYFRQQRDSSIHRGYSQKSIVLISHLPFVALFSRILSEVALAFFTAGESAIETACRQIGQHWPLPEAGGDRLISLPLFGLRFCCSIPADLHKNESELDPGTNFEQNGNLPFHLKQKSLEDEDFHDFELIDLCSNVVHLESISAPDLHFHTGIKRLLPHLHLLWELVLLGESLLVYAPNASICSSIVHSIVSLIYPLKYEPDYRPYFTIHDSDFNDILNAKQNCRWNSMSNPFFLKIFVNWPHILKIGAITHKPIKRERSESRLIHQLRTKTATQFVLGTIKRCGTAEKGLKHLDIDVDYEEDGEEWQGKIIKRLSDRSHLESRSGGFFTSHKQFLAQDKTLTKRLMNSPSDSISQWKVLRWYFLELTQSFMSPLESYIATLMPLKREICPFQTVPQMRPFSLEQFLTSLKYFALYRQFVTRSPNFIGWLRRRQIDIERRIRLEHMEAICNTNFSSQILSERSQVEIVDLLMKLANRIVELNEKKLKSKRRINNERIFDSNNEQLERQLLQLQNQLKNILSSVDEELKIVLLSNSTFRNVFEQEKFFIFYVQIIFFQFLVIIYFVKKFLLMKLFIFLLFLLQVEAMINRNNLKHKDLDKNEKKTSNHSKHFKFEDLSIGETSNSKHQKGNTTLNLLANFKEQEYPEWDTKFIYPLQDNNNYEEFKPKLESSQSVNHNENNNELNNLILLANVVDDEKNKDKP
ncbi:UDENN domain-containing protein [Meloidogyne graminicola]|uniref:UDENN domain-containing protein n=1 Tax=Meloidogyne graminicola TaxID=189291 RepID=A0A8S9ZWW3_9BILA|nr:UDENN domain-containing protein [Meloidogyne graminicola]